MAMVRPKVSNLVASQLPEHIRNEQPQFVAFLEAYYRYLEDQEINLTNLRDLDNTLDDFVVNFKNELGQNLPYTAVDERFLLQHIKDLYLAKGSEASYDLLFKILFGKQVTLDYPSLQMLRASDGKWNQDISVFVEISDGSDPNEIVGKLVDVITPNKIIRVLVDRRQYVEVEVERAIKVSDTVYELILDRRFFGDINVGDRLRYRSDAEQIYFSGDILATTTDLRVEQKGTGFKVGELYDIRNFDGYGTIMKVKSVDANGGINAAEFIKYGIGYSTEFTTTLIPKSGQDETASAGTSVLRVLNELRITDRMGGFSEKGSVIYQDYIDTSDSGGAWDGTYAGQIQREFGISTTDALESTEDPAIIAVGLGAIANYPGYYINNDGFLDDAIYIQDSRYYQAYSYLIKIDETLESYQSAVKTLIHPAGMAVFGEYDIRNEFDLSVTLESLIKILNITAADELFATEDQVFDGGVYDSGTNSYRPAVVGDDPAHAGIQKYVNDTPLYAAYLSQSPGDDDNTFFLVDTAGSNTTRTNPDYSLSKALFNGELDYDGNVADHSFSLESHSLGVTGDLEDHTDQFKDFGKTLNATSENYDGSVDNESVVMGDTDGVGSLRVNPYFDITKPLATVYNGITELPQTTMVDGSSRFGLSVIDMEKELNDAPVATEYLRYQLTMDVFTDSTTESDEAVILTSKLVDATTEDYDGSVDDETVTVTEVETFEISKPLVTEQTVTEVPQTTMSNGTARFGIAAVDSDKSLSTDYSGMSDTDAADANDLNRTVPAIEVTTNLNDVGINYDGDPMDNTVSFSESGFINKNPYGEAGFFLNDDGIYVSDNYQTIS